MINHLDIQYPENLRKWWQKSVVYQIYWRSFQDSNGDGIGDLGGVLQRLDYIQSLGIDVIWFNPFYESPDIDNGYDISDYYQVMQKAGTIEQTKELLKACADREIRVILDLVVNHSSDQHAWFVAAADPSHPCRDYYIWKEGTSDKAPNNWRSWFEPSSWTYHKESQSYYFHSFASAQPDLNWQNETLRTEIFTMMSHWLDLGISGFRLDVINMIGKSKTWEDAADPYHLSYLANRAITHDYLQMMHRDVLATGDYLMVGEAPFVSAQQANDYVGFDRNELSMLFHFDVMDELPRWDLKKFRAIQDRWHNSLYKKGWVAQYLNNHDQARSVSRYGDDGEYRVVSAKMLAVMTHLIPGTPFVYQGEEIGMINCAFDSIEDYQDIFLINRYRELCDEGMASEEALASLRFLSRDNARTPMQWDDTPNAGFSTATPWIRMNDKGLHINVQDAEQNPQSILHFYRDLIALRKQHDVMIWGDYQDLSFDDDQLYCFARVLSGIAWLIVLNTGKASRTYTLPYPVDQVILGNYPLNIVAGNQLHLRPYEAQILKLHVKI